MHERAVEQRIALAQQRDVASGGKLGGEAFRRLVVEGRSASL